MMIFRFDLRCPRCSRPLERFGSACPVCLDKNINPTHEVDGLKIQAGSQTGVAPLPEHGYASCELVT